MVWHGGGGGGVELPERLVDGAGRKNRKGLALALRRSAALTLRCG
jgi:hypothetical protein